MKDVSGPVRGASVIALDLLRARVASGPAVRGNTLVEQRSDNGIGEVAVFSEVS